MKLDRIVGSVLVQNMSVLLLVIEIANFKVCPCLLLGMTIPVLLVLALNFINIDMFHSSCIVQKKDDLGGPRGLHTLCLII